jgi:hypothetical protein
MYSTTLEGEEPAAHETKDPQHRLTGTSLQPLSEVGAARMGLIGDTRHPCRCSIRFPLGPLVALDQC